MGRPSVRTSEIDAEIISRLSKGEPLAGICRDDHMPSATTVRNWQNADEQFSFAIARAREDGFDAIALEALTILDEDPERVVTMSGDDKVESRIDSASVQRAKNRFEGRLKLLSKWDPKRYGEATLMKLAGADGEGPVQTALAVTFVNTPKALTDQRDAPQG